MKLDETLICFEWSYIIERGTGHFQALTRRDDEALYKPYCIAHLRNLLTRGTIHLMLTCEQSTCQNLLSMMSEFWVSSVLYTTHSLYHVDQIYIIRCSGCLILSDNVTVIVTPHSVTL